MFIIAKFVNVYIGKTGVNKEIILSFVKWIQGLKKFQVL